MYKNPPTEAALNEELKDFINRIEEKQNKNGHSVTRWHEVRYHFMENETWALGWFYHMTYNHFDTDQAAINSFESYVRRKETENIDNYEDRDCRCLMGAEDRFRWEICHCDECAKNNQMVIKH